MARVLVADDEPSILYLYKEFFKMKGFDVDTVDNGMAVMKKINDNKYHLLVLDIKMGKQHGLEVLEKLIETNSNIPVIISTAYQHLKEDVDLISRDRLDVEFITKPPDLEKLWEIVVKLLKKHAIKEEIKPDN